jgi:hypothetical protein
MDYWVVLSALFIFACSASSPLCRAGFFCYPLFNYAVVAIPVRVRRVSFPRGVRRARNDESWKISLIPLKSSQAGE